MWAGACPSAIVIAWAGPPENEVVSTSASVQYDLAACAATRDTFSEKAKQGSYYVLVMYSCIVRHAVKGGERTVRSTAVVAGPAAKPVNILAAGRLPGQRTAQ